MVGECGAVPETVGCAHGCVLPKKRGMGYGVWGMGYGVWGMGYGVWGMGYGVWGMGYGVWGMR